MDIIILKSSEQVAIAGAQVLQGLLARKADAVLGLATGRTPLALYQQLIAACEKNLASFRDVRTFNLDEYLGVRPEDSQSYRSYMQRELFDHIDIETSNTCLPECATDENPLDVGPRYEQKIHAAGGIDLQVLGIGQKSRTRIKTLTRETIASNRQYFDDPKTQPQLAITMGIATIMDAHEILLLATGAEKAEAVRQSIEGPVSSMWPASILQMHERVTVLLDQEAASALTRQDYYNWVQDQKRRLLAEIESS